MNLRNKCFDVEIYEELEQKKLKGMVCFENDLIVVIKKFEMEIVKTNSLTKGKVFKIFHKYFGGSLE